MDGTRPRRMQDPARRGWYSHWRTVRFARHFGFAAAPAARSADRPARASTTSRC